MHLSITTMTPYEMATLAANVAESKKANDIIVLETGKVSYLADFFVICSVDSSAQLKAVADAISAQLDKRGHQPVGRERDQSARWFLLDYGDIVVSIMHRQEREYYQLEQFWSHAHTIPRSTWLQQESRQAS